MIKHISKVLGTIAVLALCVLSGSNAYAQNRTVSGVVVDNAGLPVIGASLIVTTNSTIGTVTDLDGKFTLSVPQNAVLTVSSIGYKTIEVTTAGKTTLNIVLDEDNEMLEETVVIGYGVQKKSDLTGSVASVKSDELVNRSVSDAASALQGKAAGVMILSASGAPGETQSIRVRGVSSNSGSGLGPLLIVDGLKVDNIQYLDPDMIESMEVLKDAASAAIYGAQAGNGVILITTKSGAKSKNGTIFYNMKYTISSLGRYAQVMQAEDYINFQHQAGNLGTREEIIENGTWDGFTDTVWADVLYGKGINQSHTVGFQGGNDRGNYYLSLNWNDQDGMARGDKDTYQRLTFQLNADYKIKKWLTVGTNTSIERSSRRNLSGGSEYAGSTLLGTVVLDPLTPEYFKSWDELTSGMQRAIEGGQQKVYSPKDHPDWWYSTSKIKEGDAINPLIGVERSNSVSEGWNIRGTVYGNLTPFKGLVITSRMGFRIGQNYSSSFSEPYYVNDKNHSETYSITANSTQNYYYQWENFANYTNKFAGKHDVNVMVGMSYTFSDNRGVNAGLSGTDPLKGYAENFRYISQDNGSGVKSIGGGTPSQSSQISYYGRLTYSYDNRYSLQSNFRADAFDSSKLSKTNRWGYFPSFSAGWTISNESWFKDNVSKSIISMLKLRGSWGRNGNIAVLSGYPYSTSISYNSQTYQWDPVDNTLYYGSVPDGLANPDLTWETSEQTDLGIDLRMFDSRFVLGIDWFNKDTKDLLVNISPVAEVGISTTTVNAGSVNNNGLEFEASWKDKIGDLGYSISGNFSTLHNKVTYLEPSVGRIQGSHFSDHKLYTYFEEGYPIWYLRGLKYVGVNSDGDPLYESSTGEPTTNPTDDDLTYVGSALPTFNYGITIRLDYKNFDFTVFGQGAGGNTLVPCIYRPQHSQINGLKYFNDEAGKSLPEISKFASSVNFWSSDATCFKGDYFKIKQIQLGYTMPKAWTKKVLIENLRAFVSLDDYFLFTKYPGFDPETATTGSTTGNGLDKGTYPNAKKLLFGINVSF